MEKITAQDEEIATMREERGYTYKAISELYGISSSAASLSCRRVQRRRREKRLQELRREANQKTISFDLTLGEAEILLRILLAFTLWKMDNGRYTVGGSYAFCQDVDYLVGGELHKRLKALECKERIPLQFD